jgi:cobalamin synthase
MVAAMDRLLLPRAARLTLGPVCIDAGRVGVAGMSQDEAREIMGEIDAKSSALLAVLAIILATAAFVFSLDQSWLTLLLMFGQVSTVSASILLLLRCLVYEPAPRLAAMFRVEGGADRLQVEAIKQVHYFNRVIVLTVATCAMFFAMTLVVGVDAMAAIRAR